MEKENTTEIKIPHTITEIVKGTTAEFSHYKEGNLHYSIEVDGYRYEFPISTIEIDTDATNRLGRYLLYLSTDIGEASFEKTYKAITLMRYIRKAIAEGKIRWDKI